MKTLILSALFLSSSAFANCEEQALALLKTPTEQRLYHEYPYLQSFIDCESEGFGALVVLHEGVHFNDIGIPANLSAAEMEEWMNTNKPDPGIFSLINLDGTKLGKIELKSPPAPSDVIRPYLSQNYSALMQNKDHQVHHWLEAYNDDAEMLSAQSFSMGLTELNAYIHGLAVEFRHVDETQPYKIVGQREGVWYHLFTTKIYLTELKNKHPEEWKLMMSEHNRRLMTTLILNAAKVMEVSGHCKIKKEDIFHQMFDLVSDQKDLAALSEVLLDQKPLNQIFCR